MKREVGDMRNYALITTAVSALLIGFTLSGHAVAQDALADTLPSPTSATAKTATAPASSSLSSSSSGTSPGSVSTATIPSSSTSPSVSSSSVIVPVTSSGSTLNGVSGLPGQGGGLTSTPLMPSAVQDALTRLQKVDQINLDDMIRAQDAINRLDLLLEIEKRQTELKKVRDERNKPAAAAAAAAGLLGSAIPASALNLPKVSSLPVVDMPSSPPSSSSFSSKSSFSPGKKADGESSGPSSKYSIKRISGTDGRYFAVINTEDNSSQTVHSGDKLPDGSLVKSISLTNVALFKDKKSKNLTIPSDCYMVRESSSSIQ